MSQKRIVLFIVLSYMIGSFTMSMSKEYVYSQKEHQRMIEESAIEASKASSMDKFDTVQQAFDLISANYVEKIDEDKLTSGAIKGMIEELEDPYSAYMDIKKAQEFTQSLDSNFEGIGAEVSMEEGKLIIISPIKDSPAERAGLKPRDQVVKIDGKGIKGLSQTEAVMKIRGKKGTKVKIEIARPGVDHPIEFVITRDTIAQKSVIAKNYKENGKDIVAIQITSFSEATSQEFREALLKAEKDKLDGLVIDVRGNPGGYLRSVEEILDVLVNADKPYVITENRDGTQERDYSKMKKKKPYPISVLVDGGSASASEILAAALKEIGGYDVVGEKSFGKGTVQQTMPMEDGSTLKLTISKWLTPDGNWIHKKGIQPTVEVKQPDYFYLSPLQIDKTLKLDMNNEKVKVAQKSLKALGFNCSREDGYFNEGTELAVKKFQQSIGMKVTGQIDKPTAERMGQEIITKIRDEKNDLQLQRAIEVTSEQN